MGAFVMSDFTSHFEDGSSDTGAEVAIDGRDVRQDSPLPAFKEKFEDAPGAGSSSSLGRCFDGGFRRLRGGYMIRR